MTSAEIDSYYYYLQQIYKDRDQLESAEARGEARGIEIGKAKGKKLATYKIVQNLLQRGTAIKIIKDSTNLTLTEIEAIKNNVITE